MSHRDRRGVGEPETIPTGGNDAPINRSSRKAATIGFFGLGTMGYAIASRLARAGCAVTAVENDAAILARWESAHPAAGHDPVAADVVVTCVTDEAALRALLFETGGGLLARARAGQLFIDHTTTSPAFAREAAVLAEGRDAAFVDAPMSGAQAAAEEGTLSVFVGGTQVAVSRARQLLGHYAGRITHLGAVGAGQAGKLANQIAIAGTVRGLAEAVALGRGCDLDLAALLDALAAGSARSDQLEQHRGKLNDSAFAFARSFDWLTKDLALALDEARARGITLPQAALIKALLSG